MPSTVSPVADPGFQELGVVGNRYMPKGFVFSIYFA
jgi:hypothetical protein